MDHDDDIRARGQGQPITRLLVGAVTAILRVDFDLRTNRFTSGSADRPPRAWDGVKIWLHARHTDGGVLGAPMPGSPAGYTAEVSLRDGRIYIQKKVPGTSSQWPGADSCSVSALSRSGITS